MLFDLYTSFFADWEDKELPLSYELYTLHDENDTLGTLVAYGLNNSLSVKLPVGDSNNNYTLWLKMLVLDALKTSTKVIMNITVSFFILLKSAYEVKKTKKQFGSNVRFKVLSTRNIQF